MSSANSKKNWQKKDQKSALAMARWLFGPAAGAPSCQVTGIEVSKDGGSSGRAVNVEDEEKEKLLDEGEPEEGPVPEELVECLYADGEDGQQKEQEFNLDDLQGLQGHPIPKAKRQLRKDDELVLKAVMTLL